MKTCIYVFLALLCLSSCNQNSSLISSDDEHTITSRKASNMVVTITKTDGSVVSLVSNKFTAQQGVSTSSFAVVVNPGNESQQSFTASLLTASEPDAALKLTKNPGVNQTIYSNKSTVSISPGSSLQVNINSGTIITTATSVVGDEDDVL